jgi:hypothetical protein
MRFRHELNWLLGCSRKSIEATGKHIHEITDINNQADSGRSEFG